MTTTLTCRCGACRMEAEGAPIQTVLCTCDSCRMALDQLGIAPEASGERLAEGVPYVMLRKDRVRMVAGEGLLSAHRLRPDSPTRRAVATCCNSFFFTDFTRGHWLSVSAARWPAPVRPQRRASGAVFMAKLLGAWARMGLRTPRLDYPHEETARG